MNSTDYPRLYQFLDRLEQLAPMQRRTFESGMVESGAKFLTDAESFFGTLDTLLQTTDTTLDQAVLSYVSICKDALKEQFKFSRTGQYSATSLEHAQSRISDYNSMMRYMLGLAISQYMWPQHYGTFGFFREFLNDITVCDHYLEIGPGHGLYLLEALHRVPAQSFDAVDISQASIDIAESLVSSVSDVGKNMNFHVKDIFEWSPHSAFDVIVMGEVLEHVEDPVNLLERVASFLMPQGKMFITTCANCPAIDHIYLFKSVSEIRALIANAECNIEREHVYEQEVGMRLKNGDNIVTTQYAAVLSAKE